MNHSEKVDLIIQALNKAQAKVKDVVKDAKNPFFKSNYAPLENYIHAFHEYFTPEGLVFTQGTELLANGKEYLSTTIWHVSGQWIKSWYPLVPTKTDPQAMGAAHTYAKRYDLSGITGMPSSDDDSECAMDRGKNYQETNEHSVKTQNRPTPAAAPTAQTPLATEKQLKRLYAISKKCNWSTQDVKDYLSKMGLKESKELNFIQYDRLVKNIEEFPKDSDAEDFNTYLGQAST